jgi:hypothetical protein
VTNHKTIERGKKLGLQTNTKKENAITENTRMVYAAGWSVLPGFIKFISMTHT